MKGEYIENSGLEGTWHDQWLACSAHTPGTHPGNAAFPCGAHRVCARSSSDTARASVDEWQRTRVDLCWLARRHLRPQQPQVRRRASASSSSAPSACVTSERTQRRAPLDTFLRPTSSRSRTLQPETRKRERGKKSVLKVRRAYEATNCFRVCPVDNVPVRRGLHVVPLHLDSDRGRKCGSAPPLKAHRPTHSPSSLNERADTRARLRFSFPVATSERLLRAVRTGSVSAQSCPTHPLSFNRRSHSLQMNEITRPEARAARPPPI